MSILEKKEVTKTYHVITSSEACWNIVADKAEIILGDRPALILFDKDGIELGHFISFLGYYYDYS
jgi:hypothetical protein